MKKVYYAGTIFLIVIAVIFSAGCTTIGTQNTAAEIEKTDVIEKTTLVIGTNAEFQPYEFYENGKIVGIDIEIMEAVAKELGMTLKVEDMKFDTIIAAISTGKVDLGIAGMSVTEDRQKNVDFSDTYTTSKQVIIVKDGSPITDEQDFAGKKIGVQLGTTADIYATDFEGKVKEIIRLSNPADLFQALSAGKIDCIIIDEAPALKYSQIANNLKILPKEFVHENYAIAVKKGNTELLTKINTALAKLKTDGTIDKIVEKYIN